MQLYSCWALRVLCLIALCSSGALKVSGLKFLVITDPGDQQAVRLAADEALKSNRANLTFEYRVVTSFESLQSLVNDVCDRLPIAGIAYLSSVPHLRCLAASLATHLDLAFVAAAFDAPDGNGQAASSSTAACGPEPVTVQLPMRHFLQSVGAFTSRLNLTGFAASAVLFDDTWDPTSLLPGRGFPGPAYLFLLPSNATELPDFLESVRNRTKATLFVLASDSAVAEAVLTAASQVRLTTRFFTWFYLNSGLMSLRTQQPVYQVAFLPDNAAATVAMATLANRTGSGQAARFGTQSGTLSLLLAASESLLGLGAATNFASPTGNCSTRRNASSSSSSSNSSSSSVTQAFASAVLKAANLSLLLGNKPAASAESLVQLQFTLHLQSCLSGQCASTGLGFSAAGGRVIFLPAGVANASALPQRPRLKLKVLTMPEAPFVFYENGTYSGYSISVLESIAKQLDFDYVISQPPDGAYGVLLANGSWNGMIGQLAALDADVAVGPISVTAERQRSVDFSIPYYDYAGLQIFMRRIDGGAETSMFFFVMVFDGWVWLCLGCTLVATGLLVTLFDRLSPYSFQNRPEDDLQEGEPEGKVFSFKESMWFVLGAVTQAGESFDPRATSTRFLVAGFWIFACIIMALYTANLAAFLTVSKLSASISSVRELAGQTAIKYSVQRDTIGFSFFQQMRDIESKFYDVWRDLTVQTEFSSAGGSLYTVWEYPIEEQYTDMFRRMSAWGFFNTTAEAIDLVRTGQWGMFLDTPLIKYYMGKDCNLISTGQILSSRPYGIALQKNSPLTSLFNMAILSMQNDRSLEALKVYWWEREKLQCPSDKVTTGVQLKTLSGVFVLLGVGIGAGFIVLIAELIVAKIWGTERFKPDSMVVSHLAPKPASFRRSQRRNSNCSSVGGGGGVVNGGEKSPNRLSVNCGNGHENGAFRMDELPPPEVAAVATAAEAVAVEAGSPAAVEGGSGEHRFL